MEINRIEALAQRVVQTHSWGHVVWHVWGVQYRIKCVTKRMNEDSSSIQRPLVLLHGGSGSWTHWLRNVEYFAKCREVWALDIPGCGDSSLPSNVVDADDLVPYIADILSYTFHSRPVDVIGFSFGGMTAGLVAAEYPILIRQLVLVGAPGLGLLSQELPMLGMKPYMNESAKRLIHRHNLSTMMFAHSQNVTDEVVDLQEANVARDRLRRRRIARTNVLAQVQTRWACSVHGIWGEFDALYKDKLQQVPQVLTQMATFHIVPNAGHWVMFEQPDAFHTIVDTLMYID